MQNQETARMAAKSKMKLSATVLGLLILFGMAVEYARESASLSQATIIYVKSREARQSVLKTEAPASTALEQGNNEPQQAAGVSAEEFVRYLREMSDKADALEKPQSALGQIVLPAMESQPVVETVVFDEQVIEITDDNGEVVEIVEVRTEPDRHEEMPVPVENNVVEERMASDVEGIRDETPVIEPEPEVEIEESVSEEVEISEPIVNTDENTGLSEEDGQAVDMMKEIIEREQAQEEKNN